jgi:hypothetical protein
MITQVWKSIREAFAPLSVPLDDGEYPWRIAVDDGQIDPGVTYCTLNANGQTVMNDSNGVPMAAARQRRIVACVNFCRNIDTDTLERLKPPPNIGAAEY